MNIYLDIDGVLLAKQGKTATDFSVFLEYVTSNFECYWLTTHCRNGENKAIEYLSPYISDKKSKQLLHKIKPSFWNDLKTEGINLKSEFIWLEDNPFESEKRILKEVGKLDSLFVVDLKNPNELLSQLEKIKIFFKKNSSIINKNEIQ